MEARLPFWYRWHIHVQAAGTLIAFAAFAVGVYMVPRELQFQSVHGRLGLALTAALVILPFHALARLRDPESATVLAKVRFVPSYLTHTQAFCVYVCACVFVCLCLCSCVCVLVWVLVLVLV